MTHITQYNSSKFFIPYFYYVIRILHNFSYFFIKSLQKSTVTRYHSMGKVGKEISLYGHTLVARSLTVFFSFLHRGGRYLIAILTLSRLHIEEANILKFYCKSNGKISFIFHRLDNLQLFLEALLILGLLLFSFSSKFKRFFYKKEPQISAARSLGLHNYIVYFLLLLTFLLN